jgi:hypothetical protein
MVSFWNPKILIGQFFFWSSNHNFSFLLKFFANMCSLFNFICKITIFSIILLFTPRVFALFETLQPFFEEYRFHNLIFQIYFNDQACPVTPKHLSSFFLFLTVFYMLPLSNYCFSFIISIKMNV